MKVTLIFSLLFMMLSGCAENFNAPLRRNMDGLCLFDAFVQNIGTTAETLDSYTDARYLSIKEHPAAANEVWCNNSATGGTPVVDSNAFEITGGVGFGIKDDTADISCIAETAATDIMVMVFKEKC